jgi:hypothetical protein
VCRDVPLRRPASAQEIALACQFSVPAGAIISGATLVADGGASALMSRRWRLLTFL